MKFQTKSFFRREEYRALSQLSIDGKILDVGGSKKSGYQELIGGTHEIITGNIDSAYGADVIFDAQKDWPFDDNFFHGVLLVNVLEHLYYHEKALLEAFRVLKQRGTIAGVVPFMFNVHGSPNDYFRYTKDALRQRLSDAGFTDITVQELGTGAFSVIYHCLIGFVRYEWMATPLIIFFRSLDRFISWLKPHNKMSAEYMPLGYYFVGHKTQSISNPYTLLDKSINN